MGTHRKPGPPVLRGANQAHHLGGECGKSSERAEETGNEKKPCFQRHLDVDLEHRHCGTNQIAAKQIGGQGTQRQRRQKMIEPNPQPPAQPRTENGADGDGECGDQVHGRDSTYERR